MSVVKSSITLHPLYHSRRQRRQALCNPIAVGPTFIYTPGTAERLDTPEFRDQVLARTPAGRIGTITDVAGAVVYLSSPSSDLVTARCCW